MFNSFKAWKLYIDVRVKGKITSCFGTPMQTLGAWCGISGGSGAFPHGSVLPAGIVFVQQVLRLWHLKEVQTRAHGTESKYWKYFWRLGSGSMAARDNINAWSYVSEPGSATGEDNILSYSVVWLTLRIKIRCCFIYMNALLSYSSKGNVVILGGWERNKKLRKIR